MRFVIRADTQKHISFCAVQSEAAEPYLLVCGLTREDVLDRFLFVEGPGQFSQASTGKKLIALYRMRVCVSYICIVNTKY